MLHGDISNQRSHVFGFRCENSLLHFKDSGLIDRFLNTLVGKSHRAEVDEDVYALMDYIYWDTEYTVVLVVDDAHYTEELKDFLSDFPFNQVVNVRDEFQVRIMLHTGELDYYIDNCESSRYKVQSEYAVTTDVMRTILPRYTRGRLT